jgi:hypothetical protein
MILKGFGHPKFGVNAPKTLSQFYIILLIPIFDR